MSVKLQEAMAAIDAEGRDGKVPDHAVQLLQQVSSAEPDRPDVEWYLGVVAARRGDNAEARQRWQHLLTLLPPADENRQAVEQAIKSLK
jgi:cytochrome c-type biogenesis protein CcmH/NrfG